MRLDPHDNTAKDYRRARELRNGASPVEQKLWGLLREAAKAANIKFRRQQPIHPYIVDFACMQARLVIEIDGDSHADTQIYDTVREQKIVAAGYTVLRFCNDDVVNNTEGVATTIIEQAEKLLQNNKVIPQLNSPLPDPPRKGEGNPSHPATL